jgi:hypothetical protein
MDYEKILGVVFLGGPCEVKRPSDHDFLSNNRVLLFPIPK